MLERARRRPPVSRACSLCSRSLAREAPTGRRFGRPSGWCGCGAHSCPRHHTGPRDHQRADDAPARRGRWLVARVPGHFCLRRRLVHAPGSAEDVRRRAPPHHMRDDHDGSTLVMRTTAATDPPPHERGGRCGGDRRCRTPQWRSERVAVQGPLRPQWRSRRDGIEKGA